MKKIIFIILFFGLVFGIFNSALSQEKIEVYFFYSPTCPHCHEEGIFLGGLENKYSEIEIKRLAVYRNVSLLEEFYRNFQVPPEKQGGVPITFIEDRYFLGFSEEIGKEIEDYIIELSEGEPSDPGPQPQADEKISIPFIGEINISKFPPIVLAIVLGALDGFNICSLGALVLILGLVLALRSKIKIIIFGGTFILTTAIVYGILIVFWYKLFDILVPYQGIMEALIGLLGMGGGIYFLRQFLKFRKHGPTCELDTGEGIASKFSSKIQELLREPGNLLVVVASIFLFAAVITIVEFPCSAVVPVAFAGILAQCQLSTLQYFLCIAIFTLFYMLDEIIVFLIAVFTTSVWLASGRIVTWATLIEAIILFLLGIYYLKGIMVFL